MRAKLGKKHFGAANYEKSMMARFKVASRMVTIAMAMLASILLAAPALSATNLIVTP